MKWPFVSRSHHYAALQGADADANATIAILRRQSDDADRMFDDERRVNGAWKAFMEELLKLERANVVTERKRGEDRAAELELALSNLRGLLNANYEAGGDNLLRAKGAEERAARAEAMYDDLSVRYHTLRLQGATTPEPERVIPVKPVDLVLSAINDASAGKDAKVRVGMIRQAAVDKEAGLKETDIILRIQRGNRPAEEVG